MSKNGQAAHGRRDDDRAANHDEARLFVLRERKKCDALLYMACRNCKYYKPKKWGAKQEIERAIKDYEKFKNEQCRAK